MKALENAHKAELKELVNKWDNILIPNFENETTFLELELKKKHQNELEVFKEELERGTTSQKIHYSGEILNM